MLIAVPSVVLYPFDVASNVDEAPVNDIEVASIRQLLFTETTTLLAPVEGLASLYMYMYLLLPAFCFLSTYVIDVPL